MGRRDSMTARIGFRKALFLVLLCLVPASQAAKPGAGPVDTPVISVLNDNDPLFGTTGIRSDGQGSYTNSGSVLSILQAGGNNGLSGDWELNTQGAAKVPATRSITFDFSDPVTPGNTPPFGNLATVPGRIIAKPTSEFVSMPAMTVGQQVAAPMALNLTVAGQRYDIGMGGSTVSGTDKVTVTCVTASAGNCVQWTVTTLVSGRKNVGRLVKHSNGGKLVTVGDYNFSFSFKVAMPGFLTTP
jgi:hypothetical protein